MRIQVFQHVSFEGLAAIQPWAESRDHVISYTRFFADERPVTPENYDWLIIMGGPMGVHDEEEFPWLKIEKMAIAEAIQADKIILGICLGAQLLAHLLGAKVSGNKFKEIGWHRVQAVAEHHWAAATLNTFHWHGDTFTLPLDAVHLASSEACTNQGFIWRDRVIGLQFHPEANSESIATLISKCALDLTPGPYVQNVDSLMGREVDFIANREYLHKLLLALESRLNT